MVHESFLFNLIQFSSKFIKSFKSFHFSNFIENFITKSVIRLQKCNNIT